MKPVNQNAQPVGTVIKHGFAPFYDNASKALILGSFPSVKSRQSEFYYGNPQNRFWRILSSHFGEPTPLTLADKHNLLKRSQIALWDVVESCEIVGSQDSTIKNFTVADIRSFLPATNINTILINGGTAAKIYEKHFKDLPVRYIKLPSTSPANTRCNEEVWHDALSAALGQT